MQQQFYMKETFYGDEVRVVFLPLEIINNNKLLKKGVKNLGFNEFKLRHNNVRAKTNFFMRVLDNFYNCDKLSWLTMTFRENITDLARANKELRGLLDYLVKRHPDLRSVVIVEPQKRGAWHFHLLLDDYFDVDEIRR